LAIGSLASIKKSAIAVVVLEWRNMGDELVVGGDLYWWLLEDLIIGMGFVPIGIALLALDEVYLAEEWLDLSHGTKILGLVFYFISLVCTYFCRLL
jgi:hypothetical protein